MPAGGGGLSTFASLFLGLVSGTVPVRVLVNPPVAAVEFRLDGVAVGRRDGPPWTVPVALGDEVVPRARVAAAMDANGNEIARARQ